MIPDTSDIASPFTRAVRVPTLDGDPYRACSTPIYQCATFEQDDPTCFGRYDYSRSGNPTRDALERHAAALELPELAGRAEGGGDGYGELTGGTVAAAAFSSGLAAIATVFASLPQNSRIVVGDDLYGGTSRLLRCAVEPYGIEVTRVDAADPGAVARAVRGDDPAHGASGRRCALVYLETPSNPLQRVADLREIARIAHGSGALLAVDATMMTPHLQRPLSLGADIVVHSATKGLCGHADVTAGIVAARDPAVIKKIKYLQNALGNALAPFESWLLLRGMKTLAVRIERQQRSALEIARALRSHDSVRRVHYVGLENHPGHDAHARQADGPGCVISVELDADGEAREGGRGNGVELAARFVRSLRLFANTVSFGSINSTVSIPACMSHASVPDDVKKRHAIPGSLVRLSIGLEDPADLLRDIERALEEARQEREVAALAQQA